MRVVSDRRQGRWNYYSLRPEVLEEMAAYLLERRPDEAAWSACGCDVVDDGRCCV
jgi:DNA-binding transcriptional ArsR family regulator